MFQVDNKSDNKITSPTDEEACQIVNYTSVTGEKKIRTVPGYESAIETARLRCNLLSKQF